jgi:hypothetical protein
MGADIVVGEGQSIGNALNFGGPYVGLFATRQKYLRQMPGRLCGETVDAQGRRGFVLTLSTREQHIRREKATSNICTNSGLCALAFSIHMTLLGETGLRRLAQVNHANAALLAERVALVPGVSVLNETFFNEFTIRVTGDGADIVERLAKRGILGGVPVSRLSPGAGLDDLILIAGAATGADSTQDVTLAVFDQHGARLGQEFTLGCRGERDKKVGVVFGAFCQYATRCTHAHCAPGFTTSDVKAEHAGAVFTGKGYQLPRCVQHDHTHRFVVGSARGFERFLNDVVGLVECEVAQNSLQKK